MRFRAILATLFLLLSASVFAQSAAGLAGISGLVHDQSGAVVPNAKVVISSEAQGTIRTLTTNDSGLFSAPALTPASGYRVSVDAPGFAAYNASNLTLQVGQNMDLHITLSVATSSTQVDVSAAAPLVEDTKTDVSGVVTTQAIQDLPINGRRVDSFVLLMPGVTNDGTFGLLTFRGVAGQNSFLVDGIDTTEQFYNENAGRTRIAAQISQDAVQEFQVVSSNYSAEYGRAMGGIVNTVTRSGSNAFHGTGYTFYRSTGFDARDPFATFVPSEKRWQNGGSLGGRLIKDKLFFFLNTEVTRRNYPLASSLNTTAVDPTAQSWKLCGVASGGFPAATPAQCAAINTLLPRFYGQIPRTLGQELYFARLDYHVNDKNTLTASFNFMHEISPNGIQSAASLTTGAGITSNGDDAVRVANGGLLWTWAPTASFVNEARWGVALDRQADTFDQSLLGGGIGFLQVSVNGTSLGQANYLPRVEPSERRFEYQDNATWMKGKHAVKFGFDIANTQDYTYFISNSFGSYTYQSVNAFALDYSDPTAGGKHWQTYAQTFGNPVVNTTINDYGLYLQDQWRISDRLTFNYGARWDYAQLPQPTVCNQDYPNTCHVDSSPTNLAPRAGIAYRLNDKTVIQAGYGIFFARFQAGTLDNLFSTGNGKVQQSISLSATQAPQLGAGPVFPNALAAPPTVANTSATNLQMMAPNIKTPYSEQGNIGIQRELMKNLALNVSYIWSRGLQLYGIRDLNLPTTTTNFTYTIADPSGNAIGSYTTPVLIGKRPDTRYGSINYAENGVNSYYNGLVVQVNKRFSHGLQGTASYTWSHEIDDGQSYGESTNNLFLSSAFYWLENGNYKLDKGSGVLDQRHRFVLAWDYQLPQLHRDNFLVKYLVNNWQLSSITTMQSGHPYGSMIVFLGDTPVTGMFSNFSLNGSGLSSRVPWLPVDNYYYPPTYRSDARLSKILPIGPENRNMRLYLNFEVFNLANTWSATGFTSNRAYTEAKGVITQTPQNLYVPSADAASPDGTEARRMQISARFVF